VRRGLGRRQREAAELLLVHRLAVQRDRVVHAARDARLGERLSRGVAVREAHRELVIDVRAAPVRRGQLQVRAGEELAVARGVLLARGGEAREVRELRAQHRRLQLVEAAVVADFLVQVGLAAAVVAQHPEAGVVARLARGDQARVAVGAEVLRRIEREAAEFAPGARLLALPVGADRLRAVLHQDQAALCAQLRDRRHLRALAEQVHHDHRARARGERALQRPGGEVEARRVDVREHGRRAHVGDRLRRGDEGERRRHHLVARPHARGP
jgi:hypothetical protein